jgi:FtsH-binding integral membrane protein
MCAPRPHAYYRDCSTAERVPCAASCALAVLFAAHCHKDQHPTNLYLTLGFTVALAWGVAVTCARFQRAGLGLVVLEAVGLTASVTTGLTLYTLRSKQDFSYLGAGLGAGLWVLIIGGLIASLTGLSGMHFALSVGGAALFSLYIVYDVHEISKRMSPDEYVPAAISLYLDIVNLFLHILRILAAMQQRD